MEYRLSIYKGDELILDREIDADTVISLMRPTVALGGVPSKPSAAEEEEDEPRVGGRRQIRCGKCHKLGHQSRTCGVKKK